MATCTECRGTKTYQPLLGPPELCRACTSKPLSDLDFARLEESVYALRAGGYQIALDSSCQLEPLTVRSHIVGEYRRAVERLDVTSPGAATKPVKFSERLPDDTAPAVLYWSVRAKGWLTWNRAIDRGWAEEWDAWGSLLDSYWLPMPPPPPGETP